MTGSLNIVEETQDKLSKVHGHMGNLAKQKIGDSKKNPRLKDIKLIKDVLQG